MASASTSQVLVNEPSGHAIGTSTIGAALGGAVGFGVGTAIADIIVNYSSSASPVEDSIATLINFILLIVGILVGGKFTPTNQAKEVTHIVHAPTDNVTPDRANVDTSAL